jgi:hypothetical protein
MCMTTTLAVHPHTRHYGRKTSVYEKHPELRIALRTLRRARSAEDFRSQGQRLAGTLHQTPTSSVSTAPYRGSGWCREALLRRGLSTFLAPCQQVCYGACRLPIPKGEVHYQDAVHMGQLRRESEARRSSPRLRPFHGRDNHPRSEVGQQPGLRHVRGCNPVHRAAVPTELNVPQGAPREGSGEISVPSFVYQSKKDELDAPP